MFFETTGYNVPIEFKVTEVVSGQKFGVFSQAGIVSILVSVKK